MWAKKKILTWLFLLGIVFLCAAPTVLWDRNVETNVVDYHVYWSQTGSRQYDWFTNTGNAITSVVPFIVGTNWYAVTALDADGLESGFSAEVTYVPTNYIPPWTTNNPGGGGTNNPPGGTNNPPGTNITYIVLKVAKIPTGVAIWFNAETNTDYVVQMTFDFNDWYDYTVLRRDTPGDLTIPLWTSFTGNAFFRVRKGL